MSKPVTAALEAYVLAPDDAARQAVLDQQLEGSEAWYELSISDMLRKDQYDDPKLMALLRQYQQSFPGAQAQQLELRAKLLQCSSAASGDAASKKPLLAELGKDHLGLNWSHSVDSAAVSTVHSPSRSDSASDSGDDRPLRGEARAGGRAQTQSSLPADALPTVEKVLQKLYRSDQKLLRNLPTACLEEVDFSKFPEDNKFVSDFLEAQAEMLPLVKNQEAMLDRILSIIVKTKEQHRGAVDAPSNLLRKLTLEQLEKLRSRMPDLAQDSTFIKALMHRKFRDAFDPEAKELLSRAESKALLADLLAFVDQMSGDPSSSSSLVSLRTRLLLELLQLTLELNELDKQLFLQYCQCLAMPGIRPLSKEILVSTGSNSGSLLNQPIFRTYVKAFILEAGFPEKVKQYFLANFSQRDQASEEKRFARLCDEALLLSGSRLEHRDIDAAWVEELANRSEIMLLPHNQERFEPEADVSLKVRLKNVPQLTVKIYEINLESYYLHHQRPFTSDIDLDGVGATCQVEYTYAQPPIVEHDEELHLPQLSGKVGLFVIDLVGSGLRSRAVLRKGTLLLVHRATSIGHIAYVLGSDREVVTTGAKLYLGGHWYESDPSHGGRIVIPYGRRSETLKVVISACGTAQFSEFHRKQEEYQLKAVLGLIKESVIVGQEAKLLVRPKLLCNGQACPLELAKKAEVTVSMLSGSDNIPTVRTFPIDMSGKDTQVSFTVPPKVKNITASLLVEVPIRSSKTEGEKQALTREERWSVQAHNDGYVWFDLFLSHSASGYEVHCLGKDGEPQRGQVCSIKLAALQPVEAVLTTDDKGVVKLGPLVGVTSVEATVSGLKRKWHLIEESSVQSRDMLNILEGEEISMQVPTQSVKLLELSSEGEVVRFCDESLEISKQSIEGAGNKGSFNLKVKGLSRGNYRLLVLGSPYISLQVHRGKYWREGYIQRHDSILEGREHSKVIGVADAKATPAGVSALMTGCGDSSRVHVVGLRFLPCQLSDLTDAFQHLEDDGISAARFPFQMWKNIMQSNVALGDEMSYVLRRRKAEAQVGNLLKRPALLMQPHKVQDTAFGQEMLAQSQAFCAMPEMARCMQAPCAMMQQACMPASNMAMRKKKCKAAYSKYEEAEEDEECSGGMSANGDMIGSGEPIADIQGFQNFLRTEPLLMTVDVSEGLVNIPCDLSNFSCVLLLATDKYSAAHRLLPVGGWPEPATGPLTSCRGLSLPKPLHESSSGGSETFFVEKRTATSLEAGATFQIADQQGAEWRSVDGLEPLLAFYRATGNFDFEAWGLGIWNTLSHDEKLKRWSSNACHELNLFVYFKDPSFFKEVVFPFLSAKMEPGLIDNFLLGDLAELEQELHPARFHSLNCLEQVLVLRALAKRSPEQCKTLASTIKAKAAQQDKRHRTSNSRNALLDAVLNLEKPAAPDEWTLTNEMEEDRVRDRSRERERTSARVSSRSAMPMARVAAAPAPPPPPPANGMFDCAMEEVQAFMVQEQPQEWEPVEATKEYAETTYKGMSTANKSAPTFALSHFWADAAEHAANDPTSAKFLSANFIFATSSFSEAVVAIALLDLPFTAEKHMLVSEGAMAATFHAASPCIFVAKETVSVSKPTSASDLAVAVRVYKAKSDETTSKDPSNIDEFIAGEPYCLQVIVTNVSPKKLDVQALVQIPQGALPLKDSSYTRAYGRSINAFACWRLTAFFYFPRPGTFQGAPVYCSVGGEAASLTSAVTYRAVATATRTTAETFADVLHEGEAAVLEFLRKANLLEEEKKFSFGQLYPLLGKESFFREAVSILRTRGIFNRTVWGYGFLHGDAKSCQELLSVESSLHQKLGPLFESALVSTSSLDGLAHLEYYPLINKRAHRLSEAGTSPPILNFQLRETYHNFLRAMARQVGKHFVDNEEKLRLSYYLLCQDRVVEAKKVFDAAMKDYKPGEGAQKTRMQRDYMAAYFDFFDPTSSLDVARKVAKEWSQCGHLKWRERFADLITALKEVDAGGAAAQSSSASSAAPASQAIGDVGESLHVDLDESSSPGLKIRSTGLKGITVKLYTVDLEMLFSRTPFIEPESLRSEFSFVKPVFQTDLPGSTTTWSLPAEHKASDLAVEVVGASIRVFRMHYASQLNVAVAERQGWLTVTNSAGRFLPGIYVKVFGRWNSREEKFFKDGYTDLRGRFEYASLSGTSTADIQKFGVLVLSEQAGGLVLEAAPPAHAKS